MHQFDNIVGAEPFNIHGGAAYKIDDMALQLSRAIVVGTLDVCCILLSQGRSAAYGACIRDLETHRPCRTFFLYHTFDLWDNLPRLIYDYRISDANVKVVNKILVMKSRPGNTGAAQPDRLKNGCRRDPTGAANRQFNVQDLAFLFLRWIFISHGPARHLGCGAHFFSLLQIV